MMSTVKKLSADYMGSHKIASMDLKIVRELIPSAEEETALRVRTEENMGKVNGWWATAGDSSGKSAHIYW